VTARWTIKHAEVAHQTPYFRVVHSRVARPDGSETDYHTLDFPRPAVAIVLRDDAGRILLIRQQRFIVDRDVWALPSGGVEDGEPLDQAALRELEEETGIRAASVAHAISFYPSYGVSNQVFHCFVATRGETRRAHDANEVERTAWFTPDEVRTLIQRGEIPDGFSLVPLLQLLAGAAPQDDAERHACRVVSLLPARDD
jgi:ADP-ribose pyrophosphatase